MAPATAKLLADAMALPAPEREHLARELLASLDAPPDDISDAVWTQEVQRRLAGIAAGTEPVGSWADMRARLHAELEASREARRR
jgi:putative addiction module component (TIGR02574 family)